MHQGPWSLCLLLSFILGALTQTSVVLPSTTSATSFANSSTTIGVSSTPQPCSRYYVTAEDGSCYFYASRHRSRNSAYTICTNYDGYLFPIMNAHQNNQTIQRAENSSFFWLGMTCTSNQTTSCSWDVTPTTLLTSTDYSNFAEGHPNISIGPCVYMEVKTGLWLSADCNNDKTAAYGCMASPNISVTKCDFSYNGNLAISAFPFRTKCFWPIGANGIFAGQTICENSCGSLASIHSDGENSFIKSLLDPPSLDFAYVGLFMGYLGNYTWDDESPYDYSNFGLENKQIGFCVNMALREQEQGIPAGKWINSDCKPSLPTVCEKEPINACDIKTTTIPTTTKAPIACPTQFLSQNGTIYSPGYPNGMDSTSCEYLITVDQGRTAQIAFSEMFLNSPSKLIFYNDIYGSTPFKTLASMTGPITVVSSTNVIRMYFNSSYKDGSYWVAKYGASPLTTTTSTTKKPTTTTRSLKCDQPFTYTGNGTIASPGYPTYTTSYNYCIYKIYEYSEYLALIQFVSIQLGTSSSLAFYSDDIGDSTPFMTLVGYQYSPSTVISPTNFIKMVYTAMEGENSGFTADFAYIANFNTTYYYAGTFTSPDYPNYYATPSYDQNYTYTLISQQSKTCVTFDDINLRNGDYIRVFDGPIGGKKLAVYGKDSESSDPFCTKTYSTMNVVFQVQKNNGYIGRGFSARFSVSIDTLTNATTTVAYYTPGYYCGRYFYYYNTVESQNYPSPYPYTTQNCSYIMNSYGGKTCLVFETFDLRSRDYITLYDGSPDSLLGMSQITRLKASDSIPTYTYCSYFNPEITLIFTTYQNSQGSKKKGFQIRYDQSAAALKHSGATTFNLLAIFLILVRSFFG